MNIINLTPHAIVVRTQDEDKTFAPSGTVARIQDLNPVDGPLFNGIPTVSFGRGYVIDLPEPTPDTFFIVSGMVFDAVPDHRTDVVAPFTGATAIRNEKGHIVAVTQFRTK